MPRYDYGPCDGKCETCGGRFEFEARMTDPPLEQCPMCDKKVMRLFTSAPQARIPRSNSDLKSAGFMKLVRRGDGSYENVTRGPGDPVVPRAPGDFTIGGKPVVTD
jgi:putative FmdB family regulatory protein